jgi:hypothetical protein
MKVFKNSNQKLCLKIEHQMIQICAFKNKEKEGGEGRPQLGGPWKVPSLVTFGRKRRNIIFTSFHFPPHKFYLNFFFVDFKILFYHGSRPLLYTFLSFSLTYKLQPRISTYQIFHTFIAKLILIDFFILFFEFMTSHMITFYKPQAT